MEWVQQGSLLRQEDLRLFKFWRMESQVFSSVNGGNEPVTSLSKKLVSDEDWDQWLNEKRTERLEPHQSGILLLIGGRAKPRVPGSEVSYLPFSKPICTKIVDVFQIHRSISRVINRNTTATFTNHLVLEASSTNHPTFVYNCRSSAAWAGDLGLSVTYSPYHRTTRAVLYGCCEAARDKFINRLENCDFTAYHPLTLPTIFAEIERKRHFDLVNPLLKKLVERVEVLDVAEEQRDNHEQSSRTNETPVQLWLRISGLRNGLESWRRQLQKMIEHCDELRQARFHIPDRGLKASIGTTPIETSCSMDILGEKETREANCSPTVNELRNLEEAGSRIYQKLLELEEEYNEKIRTCATIIDGMALAAQLEWNKIGRKDTKTNLEISKSSLDIAEATKRDGQRMRSIAVLTMIFLPATFVATVFSMTFFNWTPGQGEKVLSPYIWVYVVGTAIFTGLTMGLWFIYSRRHEEGSDANGVAEKIGKE